MKNEVNGEGKSLIRERTATFFGGKLSEHGPTPRGLDYNSEQAMLIRYEQAAKLLDGARGLFSLNDYGCGYGGFYRYLKDRGFDFQYRGYDVSSEMIGAAKALYGEGADRSFYCGGEQKAVSDYTIAISVFNIKVGMSDQTWTEYVLESLREINSISARGMAVSFLTKYSDPERMRDDLYYADPCFLFDFAKRNFSRNVALLHDYELYDFTLIVRK